MQGNSVTEWEDELKALDVLLTDMGFECIFDTINSPQVYGYKSYRLKLDNLGKECIVKSAMYDKNALQFTNTHITSRIKTGLGNAIIDKQSFETVDELKRYLLGE